MTEDWSLRKMDGFRISHPYIATTPGCPKERHPHRWCKCKVFRTAQEAQTYIQFQQDAQEGLAK